MGWFERTPEKHEAKLLRKTTYNFDVSYFNPPKVPMFRKEPSGRVWYQSGRYYIGKDLWEQRMREFRHPDAKHDFFWTGFADAPQSADGQVWPRQHAQCRKCGDKRVVSMFIDIRDANTGWCV